MRRQTTPGAALLTAAIVFVMTSSAAGDVIHVKWDSPGPTFDGNSWETAYHAVQEGLDASSSGDEVWVTAGTYVENITLKNGVGLYGGFAGMETERSQRDSTANVTILDGNEGRSVVTAPEGATSDAVIDGFTVRNGWKGIYCSDSSPTITNNTILGNSGDGIYCSDSSPTITNNTIVGNRGYGIFCSYSSPTITNNTIIGNASGIHCNVCSPTITNNTIIGNGQYGVSCYNSASTITNNIVALNGTGVYGWAGAPVLSHNDVYGNWTDYDGISPGTGDISVDPGFACWKQWDFHIQPTSPCRDAGDNSAPGLPDEDMDGQPRDDGGGLDIGADESHGEEWPPCPELRIIHVDWSASAGGDGTSWANAYQTIGEAVGDVIRSGGAEIWVAEGVYSENVRLVPFAYLYGGFAAIESQRGERDWRNNVTVIDGAGSENVVIGANISTVDGFTIRNGDYGIYCRSSFATITNNTIVGNSRDGIYCNHSSSTITNNTIVGNFEDGIDCYRSSPTITNNTIVGNGGYGVSCSHSSPTITNNIVAFNSTGIRSEEGAAPVLSHNDVYGNTTDYDGVTPGTGDISEDPQFACLEMGDLHIQPTSPCRDAGDNSASGLPDADMDGQARNDGGGVDIGADESYGEQWPSCANPRIIHVDCSVSAGGDGTSWASAYQTIGDAVNDVIRNAGAEIWVAEGVYSENVRLVPFAYLYGGFAAIESQRGERDWRNNVTVIDGGGSGNVVTGANVSRIDGFSIRNGESGIYCRSNFLTITNNRIVGNSYCGTHSDDGSPTITNNTMSANCHGINCGEGSPTIANNTIMGNSSIGICCEGNSCPIITNNTILGNTGAGIDCYHNSSSTIANNIVAFNSTGIEGSEGAAPVLSHNDVYGNTTDYDGISPGVGDISEDPEFACWERWDLHIQPTSACRNAGDNSAPGLPDTDMDGQARNDGGGVDIGADESYGEQWPPCPTPRIVYVDGSASPGGDGTSWATAYRAIGEAVGDVRLNGPAEIWVAEGVYSENVSLVPFAHMYGGFAGIESQSSERNWRNNVTVIDGGGGCGVTGANISTIDGFTIRNGWRGICCFSSFLTITNNTIIGNARGIYCCGSPTITSNTIRGNSQDGIYCFYGSPTVTNNRIIGNSSSGIHCGYNSAPTITGNTISGNGWDGIYCYDSSSTTITNNTILGNRMDGISCWYSSSTITNNIVAFNAVGIDGGSSRLLSHNDVYGNSAYDYRYLRPGVGDISEDPEFACLGAGDFHIQPTSPCRDAGDNSASGLPDTDMDGQARNDGGGVDIGADESYGEQWPPCPPRIVHVDASASPGGDGTSWTNAYQTIGEGIENVRQNGAGEIWVARGIYNQRVRLIPFAHLYGGFAGMESQRSKRDWRNNVTVIDGGGSGNVVTGANISTIDGFTIRNGWNGIDCHGSCPTITNNTIVGNCGYGICSWYSSPTITNNTIVGNYSCDYGIYCYYGSPTITNNTIISNSGDGICCDHSFATITDNIVAFNSTGIYRDGGVPVLSHNDVYGNAEYDYLGLSPGVGDISLDPLFADPVGGDYHLRFDSPCIDTGTNEDAPSTDMDGNPRPVDGNCDGIPVADIGAYEYQPIPLQVDVLPGDDANVIRLRGNRLIPVAILSDSLFDARNIIPVSVLFGPGCAQEVHGRGHWEDVNRDGLVDLLLHFSCGESGIDPGDESVSLCGWTVGGERIAGSDTIRVIAR